MEERLKAIEIMQGQIWERLQSQSAEMKCLDDKTGKALAISEEDLRAKGLKEVEEARVAVLKEIEARLHSIDRYSP